ncbi:MAG: hypothetical protein ACLTF5_08515 [Butyricicoccus sp.]
MNRLDIAFDVGSQRRGTNLNALICLPAGDPARLHAAASAVCARHRSGTRAKRKKHPDLVAIRSATSSIRDQCHPRSWYPSSTPRPQPPTICQDTIFLIDDPFRACARRSAAILRLAGDLSAGERGELLAAEAAALDFVALCRNIIRSSDWIPSCVGERLTPKTLVSFSVNQMNAFGSSFDMAAADIAGFLQLKRAVCVLCARICAAEHARSATASTRPSQTACPHPVAYILQVRCPPVWEYPGLGLTILTEATPRRKNPADENQPRPRQSYTD